MGFVIPEGESYDLGKEQVIKAQSAAPGSRFLDIRNKEQAKPRQKCHVAGTRAKYEQKLDRVSKLRAEDEIAAILRDRCSRGRRQIRAQETCSEPKRRSRRN
jgi:hypothetical protein